MPISTIPATYRQPVVFMRKDCHVCRAEGIAALTRIEVTFGNRSIIATLNVLTLSTPFRIPALRVATAALLAAWIAENVPDAVLLGPDSESQRWVAEAARLAGRPYQVLTKHRFGDRTVEISIPDSVSIRKGTPVILDDIASSGHTLVQTLEQLPALGTPPAVCIVIHAVIADEAEAAIRRAGGTGIVSTDSIPHPTNAVGIAKLLAGAVTTVAGAT